MPFYPKKHEIPTNFVQAGGYRPKKSDIHYMKWAIKEALAHLLFWLISYWIFLVSFAVSKSQVEIINGMREVRVEVHYLYLPILFFLLTKALVFYGNLSFLFPKFLQKKERLRYIIELFLLILLAHVLEWGLSRFSFVVGLDETRRSFLIAPPLNMLFSLIFWGLSTAYVLGKNYLRNERLQQALRQEKLSAELQFLKAQINPHFLFNTLNNLFAMAEKSQQQPLAEGISELANLMRYMLHEANADRVPLAREIAYMQSVIELQQLRLDEEDDVLISLNVEGNVTQQEIAPLLLIPFVENAFKHGIYLQASSYIKINLKTDGKQIYFHLINSKFDQQLNELQDSSGIGLENVKRRLALIYPDQHDLQIENRSDTFEVKLVIST